MEALLHIEPIRRSVPSPLRVGHSDYVFYGDPIGRDDEGKGGFASHLRVGDPLDTPDSGRHHAHLPLVKTIGRTPDFSRDQGNLYIETLHFRTAGHDLIPFRSKVRSGLGYSNRFTHLPSLNLARFGVSGLHQGVVDPRADIITELALRDSHFHTRPNQPLREWVTEELAPRLADTPWNEFTFDIAGINQMISRYKEQVWRTSNELTARSLADIARTVTGDPNMVLPYYSDPAPITRHLLDFHNRLTSHPINFKSYGALDLSHIPSDRLEYNPYAFQAFCDLLDTIPLSDFNIDIVIDVDGDMQAYYEHLAEDRIGMFQDNDSGLYAPSTMLKTYFDYGALNALMRMFVDHHPTVRDEVEEILITEPIKIKILKTITDEAAVLLYRGNSRSDADVLCGVYFDIAAQSLSPLSISPAPIAN